MSGRKCANVTVSQDEYNALRHNARRVDDQVRAAQQRTTEERERHKAQQREFEKREAVMRAEYHAALGTLSINIRGLEKQQAQRLEQLRLSTETSFGALGRDFAKQLEKQHAFFQQALDNHHTKMVEMGQELQAIKHDIQADHNRQKEAANAQIHDLEALFILMRRQRAHERFAPGDLDALENALLLNRRNLESENYQAALAGAQERYIAYQELQLRIAERQAEWQAYLAEVRRLTEDLAGMLAAAEGAVYSFGQDSTVERVKAQVDYWSEGMLSKFHDRLEHFLGNLSEPEILSTEALKDLLIDITPMESELANIIATAKDRLIQSQVRQNIAASILDSFAGTTWELDDSTYEGEDFRRGLHVKLKNPGGEEVVASITPADELDGTTARVEINFFDKDNDERIRHARLQDMNVRLREKGVHVPGFQCLDGSQNQPGNPLARDFERLRAVHSEPSIASQPRSR